MTHALRTLTLTLAAALLFPAWAQDQKPPAKPPAEEQAEYTFRSDVALLRVDVQVLDSSNRPLTGLTQDDFRLYDAGREQPIRQFAQEEVPVDILLLIDVSGSMRSHVERLASASQTAVDRLSEGDRVAIMVFDRQSRIRMPFKAARSGAVYDGLDRLLRDEDFNGGTDITRAMFDAANFMSRNARKDARRAIVILTDDETEFDRNEQGVLRELDRADITLSALIAPDAMGWRSRSGGGGGGGWPGGGGRGGIIFGPRFPGGGGSWPGGGGNGPVIRGSRTGSAGTREIARRSGGDDFSVDDAGALDNTFQRLRQRYALFYNLPEGSRAGQDRSVEIRLAGNAARRYPNADLRYRGHYTAAEDGAPPSDVISDSGDPNNSGPSLGDTPRTRTADPEDRPIQRRRASVITDGPRGPNPNVGAGWPKADTTTDSPAAPAAKTTPAEDSKPKEEPGRWRRVKPGEQP